MRKSWNQTISLLNSSPPPRVVCIGLFKASIWPYVCPLFELPFNGLFAPTSRSRMSNVFRDSEFLGKSNGKKWYHIWTFLFGNGLKSPRQKKFFLLLLILPYKLDEVGPVDNRPSTDKLHHFVNEKFKKIIKKSDMWHVTCDTWHVTHDTWHMTPDMWHLVGGEHSLKMSAS